MSEQYRAIYADQHGQEQTIIELEPNGEFFSMTLRGIHFRGVALDTFYAWPLDQDKEKLQHFSWKQGYITAGGNRAEIIEQALNSYTLQWEMIIQVIQDNQVYERIIRGFFEKSEPTPESIYGATSIKLNLIIDKSIFEAESEDPTLGPNIVQLQRKLPQGTYLKCCQFCALSQEDFLGAGLLCYRQVKEQFRNLKYLPVRSKVQNPVNSLRKQSLYVQEVYLCPEFKSDPKSF